MWSDNDTTQDLLGFRVHAELIRAVITDSSLLPVTIGVFGDWGSGKTSVMRMLHQMLEKGVSTSTSPKQHVICLYFNGWLFEGYDDAKSALLSSVLGSLKEHQQVGPELKKKVDSLLRSVEWMRLLRLGVQKVGFPALLALLTGGTSLLPTLAAAGQGLFAAIQKRVEANTGGSENDSGLGELLVPDAGTPDAIDVRTFRDEFGKMLAESDISSLVVLIDDLDRCSPGRIVENLEAIKLFLSVDRTAFVIGADPRILRHAVLTMYKPADFQEAIAETGSRTDIVNDYLEKLIQIPYQLPKLSPAEVETYMSMLFCERELDAEHLSRLYGALEAHRAVDRYSVFGGGAIRAALNEDVSDSLRDSLAFCANAAPLITEGLNGNPRQVKRFLNAFVLRKKLAQVATLRNIYDDVLVKLMILEYAHQDEFRQLYTWQAAQAGYPKQISELESSICPPMGSIDNDKQVAGVPSQWSSVALRRWIAMEPRLTDLDLRDYFWVARDRLQSTLSNVTLVSPVARRAFEELISSVAAVRDHVAVAVNDFSPEDRQSLFSLVIQHTIRRPAELAGYNALSALVLGGVEGSDGALCTALSECPAAKIPPAVGPLLRTVMKTQPSTCAVLEPALSKLRGTKTGIAAALQE